MKRDSRGRFSKEKEKNGKIVVNLLLIIIMTPWIIIISKLNIWDKIKEKLEELMTFTIKNNEEGTKKNGIFY